MDLMGAKEQCVCEDYREGQQQQTSGGMGEGRSTKEEAKKNVGDEANRRIKNDGILWHFLLWEEPAIFCLEKPFIHPLPLSFILQHSNTQSTFNYNFRCAFIQPNLKLIINKKK
jgi:hypothetical protein